MPEPVEFVTNYRGDVIECWQCGQGFTQEEWDDRHSDSDGEDVHAHCCDICLLGGEHEDD